MQAAHLSIDVDLTNPGQFFACCGLLEIAHRLWPGAQGWFDAGTFQVACPGGSWSALIEVLERGELVPDAPGGDEKTAPLRLVLGSGSAAPAVRLDWWLDEQDVGARLKTWAGQQKVTTMARAMLSTALKHGAGSRAWLDEAAVAFDPEQPRKQVEPFYFDARRFAHALDTGFSLDAQGSDSACFPATELLCLVGLQRCRPALRDARGWVFRYAAWMLPLGVLEASAVACCAVAPGDATVHEFSMCFRDDQKRYKAFGFAQPTGDEV